MAKLTGGAIMARALKDQGVEHMFGIVGFPVQPIAREAQKAGIKFYGCRNEQSASYAAGAVGYLTGRPGRASWCRGRASCMASPASPTRRKTAGR